MDAAQGRDAYQGRMPKLFPESKPVSSTSTTRQKRGFFGDRDSQPKPFVFHMVAAI